MRWNRWIRPFLTFACAALAAAVMACSFPPLAPAAPAAGACATGGMDFFFGSLHGHSADSDGTGTPAEVFTWARDTAGYDFYALTDHAEQLSAEEWEDAGQQADLFDQDGTFTALRGFEWSSTGVYGHANVWNTDDYTSVTETPSLSGFYDWVDQRGAPAQFNHPGAYGNTFDGLAYAKSVGDNFLCQETNNGIFAYYVNNASEQFFPYYVSALDQGWRTAPAANQDNHVLMDTGIRTVVVAPELSRTAVMQALEERRVYSSDDPDMRVTFLCNGSWMGSQVEVADGGATFEVAVEDDEPITLLELVTSGGTVAASAVDDGTWGDGTATWTTTLEVGAPAWYLLRVTENDADMDERNSDGVQLAFTSPVWVEPASFSSYFAEGCTGEGFQEYLCLGNPSDAPVEARATFLFPGSGESQRDYVLPARSRVTVDVNAEVGPGREVSTVVTSGSEFVAERPLYFSYGDGWTGGSDVVGAPSASERWYFAEGYTGEGFDEWVCVLNPGEADASLTFRFQTQEAGEVVKEGYGVPGRSRATFKVDDLLGEGYQASLELAADTGVVAERPMYFDYRGTGGWGWTGGHCVMGATALATRYFLAEGTTRAGFEEWLTLQNPGASPVTVQAVYRFGAGQGAPVEVDYQVAAGSRRTVFVPGEVGAEKDVSVELACASTFMAERPMYFTYQGDGWSAGGGHCLAGCPAAGQRWFFAEGYTGEWFDEWLCLLNPGDAEVPVVVTYYPEAGDAVTRTHTLAPLSRHTIRVDEDCGEGVAASMEVEAGAPVFAERPMYFRFRGEWGDGHVAAGYPPAGP